MQAFVHLSDIWGDDRDASGLRRDFHQCVNQSLKPDTPALIVETDASRAIRTKSYLDGNAKLEVTDLQSVDWSDPRIESVGVDLQGARPESINRMDRTLRVSGFRQAGRAWGVAGQSRRYVRTGNGRQIVRATFAEVKVRAGAAIVHVRDTWLSPDLRRAWATRLRLKTAGGFNSADVLDDRYGQPLPVVTQVNARDLFPAYFGIEKPSWNLSLTDDPDPMESAQTCFEQHGLWPISFSYPKPPEEINSHPGELLAPIVPGFPYSFTDEHEYLSIYRNAFLGLTHRKAGWDCFRHLEILASGAIPLMPDAGKVPEFSLVHYPKASMTRVVQNVSRSGGPPDQATRESFRAYFREHLTARAMAEYVLNVSGLDSADRVLFVDAALPKAADYLSVLTLIGLKQLLGSRCEVSHPVDYIYADTTWNTQQLYGRGFGYTRVLDGELRSPLEKGHRVATTDAFDAVVVGSITRNISEASRLRAAFPVKRTIWIHGEDTPPTVHQVHELRSSGVHFFVRAIHSGRR